jgi:hypothetical protein
MRMPFMEFWNMIDRSVIDEKMRDIKHLFHNAGYKHHITLYGYRKFNGRGEAVPVRYDVMSKDYIELDMINRLRKDILISELPVYTDAILLLYGKSVVIAYHA